jgi:hypothetical protein
VLLAHFVGARRRFVFTCKLFAVRTNLLATKRGRIEHRLGAGSRAVPLLVVVFSVGGSPWGYELPQVSVETLTRCNRIRKRREDRVLMANLGGCCVVVSRFGSSRIAPMCMLCICLVRVSFVVERFRFTVRCVPPPKCVLSIFLKPKMSIEGCKIQL